MVTHGDIHIARLSISSTRCDFIARDSFALYNGLGRLLYSILFSHVLYPRSESIDPR